MSTPRFDVVAVLERAPLLSGLSAEEVSALAARSTRKLFKTGELLFSEGEPCRGLHIVASGKVRIFKSSIGGREQVLAVNQAGESVAELPVFDGGAYPASAVAIEETQIAFISQRDFHAYCLEHPQVALKVLSVAGVRLRRLVEIIEELSFTTVRQRLVALLVKLAQTEGAPTGQGIEFRTDLAQPDAPSGRRASGGGGAPDRRKGHEGLERASGGCTVAGANSFGARGCFPP
jgi:CRP/FNR family transcriptional regulator